MSLKKTTIDIMDMNVVCVAVLFKQGNTMNDTLTIQICVALVLGIATLEYLLNIVGLSSFMFPIWIGD